MAEIIGSVVFWFLVSIEVALAASHSVVTDRPEEEPTPKDGVHGSQISDHRFFLQEIFSKYGHEGQMTFEGFEHLLESLGLGNIIINDHDVGAHKEDSFRNPHGTHDHSKKVDAGDFVTGKSFRDSTAEELHEHTRSGSARVTVRASGTLDDIGNKQPSHQYATSTARTERLIQPATSSQRHDYHSHDSHSHGQHSTATVREFHGRPTPEVPSPGQKDGFAAQGNRISVNKPPPKDKTNPQKDAGIPELLVNLSSLVDQHQEFEDSAPEIFIEECLSPKDILATFGINQNSSLNPVSFLHLCPAIIYELDQGHCLFRNNGHRAKNYIVSTEQWLYSSLAVMTISLCGLFSVAVIPIMQKWFYRTLLQFLVGLAVGSLTGDALLHLMPHALLGGEGSHGHETALSAEAAEKTAVWRGFAALGGIFFFFIAERLLAALTVYRKQRKEAKFYKINAVGDENEEQTAHEGVGKKLSQYRNNSFDLKLNDKEVLKMLDAETTFSKRAHPTHDVAFHERSSFSVDKTALGGSDLIVNVTGHHGHGHSHGHTHEIPDSVSAVAWMVIMGDGLHNFCDGLAIGVAFASGLEGGVSTSVAVFCHELPHELGDFAMLLKTGMKVKQALFYNALSSILCFIGMVIGVSLGNVESATSWVFAATAGMFLYIALVDMLPELSTSGEDPNSNAAHQLAVQVLGISLGVSIMLLIANYEQDLQTMIS